MQKSADRIFGQDRVLGTCFIFDDFVTQFLYIGQQILFMLLCWLFTMIDEYLF